LFSLGCDVAYGFLHRIPGTLGYKSAVAEADSEAKDTQQEQALPERAPSPFPIPRSITPRPEFVSDPSESSASIIAPVPLIATSHTPARPPSVGPSTPGRAATPVTAADGTNLTSSNEVFKQPLAQTPNRAKISPIFQSPRFTEAQYLAGAPEFLRQQILQHEDMNEFL
jgi:hypothetical protein